MEIQRRPPVADTARLVHAGVHPVLARLFAARGIADPTELDGRLADLPSFTSLRGIDAAAARLVQAIERQERIVVVADYDADGATACAAAVLGLSAMGADIGFLVPNRFAYGYGLTPEIVRDAAVLGPRVLLTVDNGIASHDGVAEASARGLDVLITDHHLPAATLPAPAWIVNPNQPGCGFPCKHLAGVGVMFYVLLATRAALRARGRPTEAGPNLAALLDLVALGTVADVVRLDRVNRTFVAQGLARIRAGRARPGVLALFAAAGRDHQRATASDLGFVAGPRLNAAGRLADMSIGIRCLLAEDASSARAMAAELDGLNRERRELEAQMQQDALLDLATVTAEANPDAFTLCLYRADWHQGVVGIVASRLKDQFHRPTIVFARGSRGELKGSGRSIAGFHLRDALDLVAKRAPGAITRFGGHAFAAGLTLPDGALPVFAATFEAVAREGLSAADLRRTIASDGPLAPGELDFELARMLHQEVWGQGFPPPVFDDVFTVASQRIVGERHARLVLSRAGERFDAMLFNHAVALPPAIRAAYRPELTEWNGTFAVQLVLEHWEVL